MFTLERKIALIERSWSIFVVNQNHIQNRHYWEAHASQFQVVYPRLVKYWREYGDCKVPSFYRYDIPLGHMVQQNRREHRKGHIPLYALQALDAVGMPWKLQEQVGSISVENVYVLWIFVNT